jgi:hypothetical protein
MKLWIQLQPGPVSIFVLAADHDQLQTHPPAGPISQVQAFFEFESFNPPPGKSQITVRLCRRCPDYDLARLWARRRNYLVADTICPHCTLAELKGTHEKK